MESQRVSLGRNELISWASQNSAFSGLELSRISTVMLAQCLQLHLSRTVSLFAITDTIRAEESGFKNGTQPADYFDKSPLLGLKKKHFFAPNFIQKNLSASLKHPKHGAAYFKEKWQEAISQTGAETVTDEFIKRITHASVHELLQRKFSNDYLTGEWIVFNRHEGQNYYLCLSAHNVSNTKRFTNVNEEIYENVLLAHSIDNFPIPN